MGTIKFFSLFFILNIFVYSIFSFISMEWNICNWWLIKNFFGRIIIVILEALLFKLADDIVFGD